MVMRNWKMESNEPPSENGSSQERQMVLRPLWQRLALAAIEVGIGAAAGALILVSRDRTVWRLVVRHVSPNKLPPSPAGMRPPPKSNKLVPVLSLESGSGRTKRFLMSQCTLSHGRDLSELFISIDGISGHFVLNMNSVTKVLGYKGEEVKESQVLNELLKKHEKKVENMIKDTVYINKFVHESARLEDVELVPIRNLRIALCRAWLALGGRLMVRTPRESGPKTGWSSGPAAEGLR